MVRLTTFPSAINWKYAVGEFFLISIGVFLALAVADWQDTREDRETEIAILSEIRNALSDDLGRLHRGILRNQEIERSAPLLLAHLRAGEPYDASLDSHFGTVYEFNVFQLNTAGYESLKSMGLELISDDELRTRLTAVYELDYPSAQSAMEIERDAVLGLLRPYFLAHFRDLEFGESATPINYDALVDDIEFINVIDYRQQILIQNADRAFTRTINGIEVLLEAIDSEIGQ